MHEDYQIDVGGKIFRYSRNAFMADELRPLISWNLDNNTVLSQGRGNTMVDCLSFRYILECTASKAHSLGVSRYWDASFGQGRV